MAKLKAEIIEPIEDVRNEAIDKIDCLWLFWSLKLLMMTKMVVTERERSFKMRLTYVERLRLRLKYLN